MEVLTLLCTQVPVIGALIWFLTYWTRRVDTREVAREHWFRDCMDRKDELFKQSITEIVMCHNNANAKTIERLNAIESSVQTLQNLSLSSQTASGDRK